MSLRASVRKLLGLPASPAAEVQWYQDEVVKDERDRDRIKQRERRLLEDLRRLQEIREVRRAP